MARGRLDWLTTTAIIGLALAPAAATAAPIEFVEQRPQYMVFDDVDGSIENANWFARDPFFVGYNDVEAGFLAVHPDDSQFLIVYSTFSLPGGIGAFYQSVANDVEGIGFAHIANEDPVIPAEFFDDTPNSQVQGMLHMNRWTQYLGADPGGTDDTRISLIFGQELGHAWCSFVYYNQGMGWETNLLGRANAHWSFYVHSGGSPLQGHEWIDNGDGTFTALPQDIYRFSDLDLYLMGLMPPAEVEPWFVLENVSNCVDSSNDNGCADPEAFLFQADSYTVDATRRDVSIENVIAVEGARVPAYPDAPSEHDVSFLLIKRADETLDADELAAIDVIIARSIELFEEQTGGRGRVINRTAVADPPGGSDDGGSDDGPGPGDSDAGPDTGERPLDDTAGVTGNPATGAADSASSTAGSATDSAADGDESGSAGCGCRSEPGGPAGVAFGMLAMLGAVRRRRRA